MQYKILNEGIQNNFNYSGVEYEYDGTECNDSECGCQSGDYCRRNEYINLHVSEINIPDIVAHLLEKSNKKENPIETKDLTFVNYCVDRLVRIYKCYEQSNWEILTRPGYYGEEIDCISFSDIDNLKLDIISLLNKAPNKRIEFVLEKEYRYLIDSVKNKNWNIEEVPVSSIKVGNDEYRKKVESGFYEEHNLPIGIYLKEGDFYRIVDGYHRYVSIVGGKKREKVEIIVGK